MIFCWEHWSLALVSDFEQKHSSKTVEIHGSPPFSDLVALTQNGKSLKTVMNKKSWEIKKKIILLVAGRCWIIVKEFGITMQK